MPGRPPKPKPHQKFNFRKPWNTEEKAPELRIHKTSHLVEVESIDGGWIVYAFGERAACERAADRFAKLLGGNARVVSPREREARL